MKERPILFSGPMVRAILEGRKTQTRRCLTPQPTREQAFVGGMARDCWVFKDTAEPAGWLMHNMCPYGKPGDRLWVRETWQHSNFPLGPYDESCSVSYRADYLDDPHGPDGERSPEGKYRTWRPSIHMPRAACRIVLEITAVRVERLQEISEADAAAEGTPGGHGSIPGYPYNAMAAEHFQHVWEEINGPGSWAVNPWVWVIEFRRVAP